MGAQHQLSFMVYHLTMPYQPNFKNPFSRFFKKAHKPLQLAIEDETEAICENPKIGEEKIGDLAGISIHKFKFNCQECLIAYRVGKGEIVNMLYIDFYKVGSHENFYSELKRYLKDEAR